jgi:hypothetical protein
MDSHATGIQFSNLWLAIEGEDEISITTDDGVVLSLTLEEANALLDHLETLLANHNTIYLDEGGDVED